MIALSSPPTCQVRETARFGVKVILFSRLLGDLRVQDLPRTLVAFGGQLFWFREELL